MTRDEKSRRKPPAQGRRNVAEGAHYAFALETRKSLGQHFLKDESVIARIVTEAEGSLPLGAPRRAVEIGPGSGALTKVLLERGWNVHAVEKDPRAAEGLALHLAGEHPDRLRVVNADILRWDPDAAEADGHGLCLGNLPYYITSDILFWYLARTGRFAGAIFMIQDEVADRLAAPPGTKDYGRLSVRVQLSCEVEKLIFVPASAFSPPPKVNSAVVRLMPKPTPFRDAADEKRFGEFTAVLFSARRKMLRRALASQMDALAAKAGGGESAEAAVKAFWSDASNVGVREETRPDAIPPDAILALYRALYR